MLPVRPTFPTGAVRHCGTRRHQEAQLVQAVVGVTTYSTDLSCLTYVPTLLVILCLFLRLTKL